MKKTRDLFWTFLKIGAFTFGGGYAMVALLEREFVEDKQWLSREEFLDMVVFGRALQECRLLCRKRENLYVS